MAFYHGINVKQEMTSISTPNVADTAIPFIVGTAPVHTVKGKVNEIILANSYAEAVAALGYSDDWDKYSLCEAIYSQFKLYGRAPIILVNVLDPNKHNKVVDMSEMTFSDNKIELPLDAIENSVVVKSATSGGNSYILNTDYTVYYTATALVIEKNKEGALKGKNSAYVSYSMVDSSAVTNNDIIGGYDVSTGKTTGFELIENCFTKYNVVPDLILAPGYSSNPEVAAVMLNKTKINDLFDAVALIDADTDKAKMYTDVYSWKSNNNVTDKNQIVCWPMVTLGDKVFHSSIHIAGVIGTTDYNNGDCPSSSPSNKSAQIDGLCLADGTEVSLNLTQANYLNSNGIVTFLNFVGGFKAWGNYTACYPSNTDVKDYFINVNRMFGWINKNFVLTYWNKIDSDVTRRLVDTIVDSFNIYLNGLTKSEKILGGRIEYIADENDTASLMGGKIKVHTYLTPPSPAQEIENTTEYDVDYIKSVLG